MCELADGVKNNPRRKQPQTPLSPKPQLHGKRSATAKRGVKEAIKAAPTAAAASL
jgi:hypothetical protein